MTAEEAFADCRSVFLDAAPAIYSLSEDSPFGPRAIRAVAFCIRSGISIVTSPVTLAECLAGEVDPLRRRLFKELLEDRDIKMRIIDTRIAEEAAILRRTTRLKLPDCLQLATALVAGCDAFLTNDVQLAKTSVDLRFVLVSGLT